MDELGILAAGAGSEMPLLDEAGLERYPRLSGSQGEVANYTRPVDSSAQDEHIERRLPKVLDLLWARIRHSLTSLEDGAQKTYRA